MSIDSQAKEFVTRTDAALRDLGRAEEIWAETVRSTTGELRLHSLSLELDKAIRMVRGQIKVWADFDPAQVEVVREQAPINLLWVLSAHPSGRVREAFVHQTEHLESDRILPHLANRAIDFVAEIRQLASPLVLARLDEALTEHRAPDNEVPLSTSVHIVVTKLLAPRTAMVSPELMQMCIDLAKAANMPRARRLRGGGMTKMIERCEQTFDAAPEPASREALRLLIAYFNQLPV